MTAQEIVRANRDAKAGREAPGALILGGAHGSLAVARSLGRRGIPVWFVTHDHPIAKYSRYVARSFEWAGPSDKGAAEWLVELSRSHRPERWVLFAGGDEEVRLVARNHAMLQRAYRVTTPPWEIIRIACDKRLTARARRRRRRRFALEPLPSKPRRSRRSRLPVSCHSQAESSCRPQCVLGREGVAHRQSRRLAGAL